MRSHNFVVLGLVLGAALTTGANTSPSEKSSDKPYQGIVDRNVFALKPPPAPPDPEATKPPPVKITLTGITTIVGKKALMKTPPPPAKPGEPPKTEQSYILAPGQREGDIEVLEIDEVAGSVKVNNAGSIVTLTFEKDGVKLPASSAPGAPGLPGAAPFPPTGGIPVPGIAPNPYAPGATGKEGFNMPNRTIRSGAAGSPMTPTGVTPNTFGNAANPFGGVQTTLGGQAGAQGGAATDPAMQAALQRSAEENVLLYEANRLKNEQLRQQGVRLPRMPPHVYIGGDQQQTPVQTPAPTTPSLPFAPGVQPAPGGQ